MKNRSIHLLRLSMLAFSSVKSYLEVDKKKISKKKVEYPTHKKKDIQVFVLIKCCIYGTYRIDLNSNPTQRLNYQ